MGGTDITSTAYDGFNKIHIDSVTGDVEITVTVVEPTNLVLTSTAEPGGTEIYNSTGYRDDYRWSSSAGGESSYTGGRITGWIPYSTGGSYICKNFNPKAGYANGGYVVYRNSSGTNTVTTIGLTTSANYEIDIENDEIEILVQSSSYKYFRVSGYSGDDVPIIYQACPIEVSGSTDEFSLSNTVDSICYGLPYKTKIESEFTRFICNDSDGIEGVETIPGNSEAEIRITMNGTYITKDVFNFDTHEINIPEVTGKVSIVITSSEDFFG